MLIKVSRDDIRINNYGCVLFITLIIKLINSKKNIDIQIYYTATSDENLLFIMKNFIFE